MTSTADLLAALDARIAELQTEIRERQEELDRVTRARGDLTAAYHGGNNQGMANNSEVHTKGKKNQNGRAPMSSQAKRLIREYARPAGIFSLRDLAARMRDNAEKKGGAREDLHITHSHLSQALNAGYPMSAERAERIRVLTTSPTQPTGFEVNRRNWRGLKE